MSRLARWMMRLYPAQWRARYGDEVDALLADTGADARTVTDLAKGGVRMQFSTRSFPKLTLTLGLAGLVLGAAFSLFLPSLYVSKATMRITPARLDSTTTTGISNPVNERVLELVTGVLSRARLASMIKELDLYSSDSSDHSVERMRNDIQINFVAVPKQLKGSSAFDIAFTYPDRYKAQRTVKALMAAFPEVNQVSAVRAAPAADRPRSSILVLNEASLPQAPISPSRIVSMLSMHLIPDQYRSVATLRLKHGTNDELMAITARALSRTSLTSIMNDPHLMLYRDELRTTPQDDVIKVMRQNIRIWLQGKSEGAPFTIAFDYPEPYKARVTVEALMNLFSGDSVFAQATMGPPAILDVLDPASLPTTPSKPHRPTIALAGGILGILLGALISIVRRLWTPPAIARMDAVNG